MPKVEVFFDCSSPWSYMAFVGLQPILDEFEVELHWRPILVGGVFNAVNQEFYQSRENPNPRRQRYVEKDLRDWFRYYGLTLKWPNVFPVNSVKAMRGALVALEEGLLVPYATNVFRAYWTECRDISQEDVLGDISEDVGLNTEDFQAKLKLPIYKAALRSNTDELIDRGGFGSPTIFLNGTDMYFGNDRLPLIEHALAAARP